jgi:hypothetical protein
MSPKERNFTVFMIAAVSLGLAGACGGAANQQSETAGTGRQKTPAERPLVVVSPAAPATSPGADLGIPVKTDPGKVSVLLAASSLREGDKIRATVANGRRQTIYSEDSKTDCSIVILERWAGKTWQPVLGCAVRRAPIVVAIGPGRGRIVTIDPSSLHLRAGMPGTSKPVLRAGTYRIKFAYRLGLGSGVEEPFSAFSPSFQIRR